MPPFILHQYALSPFSAKLRAMLGYAQIEWQSAITSEMPPRPVLKELAGGYRKIPVAQVGADIFCDSRLVSEEIAHISGHAQLSYTHLNASELALARQAESQIFFSSLMLCGSWALLKKSSKAMSLKDMGRFMKDRIQVGRSAKVSNVNMKTAKQDVHAYLAALENRMTQDFLFGHKPNAADFSVFVSLWIVHVLAEKPLLRPYPKLWNWMQRMHAFDTPPAQDIAPADCLQMVANSNPRPIPAKQQEHELQGKMVEISPVDYACDASSGVLVAANDSRWVIARETQSGHAVHVHFPQEGFALESA